jgi:hypothetical protein
MARGFTIFALWMALFAVGYDRLVKVGPMEAPAPATDTEYQSMEGGDGLPPRPCCR